MKKNPNITPTSKIRASLRMLWLHSRERSSALKEQKYLCQKCGKKQSKKKGFEQKVEVHHKNGIGNWDKVIQVIREELLCSKDNLEVLCPECHQKS